MLRVEALPVAGTSLASIDLDRIRYHLETIIGDTEWTDRRRRVCG